MLRAGEGALGEAHDAHEALRREAQRWLVGSRDTLWVGEGDARVPPRRVRALLGQGRDAVVLELFSGLDLEVLAQLEGLVRAGGRLVILAPGRPPADAALAVEPFGPGDVGSLSWERVMATAPPLPPCTALEIDRAERGTDEKAQLAARLASRWRGTTPSRTALIADRGRGKSSALGLAIAAMGTTTLVSAPSREAAAEVLRFGGDHARFVELDALVDEVGARHVVIDEAAQIDVPTLRRAALAHPDAHWTWASTARGYEGTGAAWVQRFLHWARSRGPLELESLAEPIRFAAGDALERWARDLLLFDATPASLDGGAAAIEVRHVPARALATSPWLAEAYGLLMHAHHRTTPNDLRRLLDAPNLDVHLALAAGRVVGVNLVAREGGLSIEQSRSLARERIRGHVLPDTLVSHAGRIDAGTLVMVRSVRIATHPDRRRRGIARALTEHVHDHYARAAGRRAPELFGTVFGATSDLVAFRASLGYAIVRLGAAPGARSGEPSVVMLRPTSDAARALCDALREDLSRNLEHQLHLLAADGTALDVELVARLRQGLLPVIALDVDGERARVEHYLASSQTFEAAAAAVVAFVTRHAATLPQLDAGDAALLSARVIERSSWREAARRAGLSLPAAQRRLREAVRALGEAVRAESTATR